VVYDRQATFPELEEFDIRLLPKSTLEIPFSLIRQDARRFNAAAAGFRYIQAKFTDYDAICAMGCPAEWVRARNSLVSWYCFSPNREAFDLHDYRMSEMSLPRKALNHAMLSAYKATEYAIVPHIEQITTTSDVVRDRISRYLHRHDAAVISPGVDCSEFHNSGYGKFFFYPSRIVPEKRFEYAIAAFRLFSSRIKGWKLIIGGFLSSQPRDLNYFAKLKELSSGLDVEFRLNLTEPELKELYATCRSVLFCAINEDYGFIPLEAMASGKPIISVNEGGPCSTIINGKTGFLVNSPEEMMAAMELVTTDPSIVEAIGKAGRNHVLQDYTWKSFSDRLEARFKEMLK
jgi:glycosyltransferase involved in cell wall biosynthesis